MLHCNKNVKYTNKMNSQKRKTLNQIIKTIKCCSSSLNTKNKDS